MCQESPHCVLSQLLESVGDLRAQVGGLRAQVGDLTAQVEQLQQQGMAAEAELQAERRTSAALAENAALWKQLYEERCTHV